MKGRILVGAVLAFVCGALLFGCGSKRMAGDRPEALISPDELKGAPSWGTKGTCEDGKQLCAVGRFGGTRNVAMAYSGSLARARAEMARMLASAIDAKVKDYMATTTGGNDFGTVAADEQHAIDGSINEAHITLNGTKQIDSWISSSGTVYTLVALDFEGFKDVIRSLKELPEAERQRIEQNAEEFWQELMQDRTKTK